LDFRRNLRFRNIYKFSILAGDGSVEVEIQTSVCARVVTLKRYKKFKIARLVFLAIIVFK